MLKATVTIRGGDPHRSIEMSIEEYIRFIREQITLLGDKSEEEPICLVGFDEGSDCDCEGCEFTSKIDGLCDLHMDTDYEEEKKMGGINSEQHD